MIDSIENNISVIIPVFNREKFIAETIDSVIGQDWKNWELLLIDDGSEDKSADICRKYVNKDNRIKFIERKEELKGASTCRNIGIENASGKWLIFLDSDDLLAPWCIKQRLNYAQKEGNFDFLIFPMLLFKEKKDDLMILQNIQTNVHPLNRFLQRENVWLMSSVLWSKSFLDKLSGYRKEAVSFQDWEINVRALIHSDNWNFFSDAIPDNFYRQHEETISKYRFTTEHVSNNIDTFFHCFKTLKASDKYSEERRIYFGALVFEWLNRYSGIAMPSTVRRQIRERYLQSGIENFMFTRKEKNRISLFLKIADNPALLRFSLPGKIWKRIFKVLLPDPYFNLPEKNQGKHRYKCELPNQ